MSTPMKIGLLGGTGKEGAGLAVRWALHGHEVIIGSRNADKAQAAAKELGPLAGAHARIAGASNADAAAAAEVVVLTVPYAAQLATALEVHSHLEGKILVDVTVPLRPPVDQVQLPGGESAVLALQRTLGPAVRIVSAFQNVSALHLKDPAHRIECDVFVCGDDAAARSRVIELAADAGMRGLHAGALANSAAAEALTSVLIAINKHYKVPASGVMISGLPEGPAS